MAKDEYAMRLMTDIDFRISRTSGGQKLVYPDMLTESISLILTLAPYIDLFHRLSAQVRFARALRAANAKLPDEPFTMRFKDLRDKAINV
jgi:hypothetical protein